MKTENQDSVRRSTGFSLVELMVVISIIGILIAFMVPRMVGRLTTQARIVSTRQEMEELKKALVGDPSVVVEGELVSVGYYGDVGSWPPPAAGDTLGLTWLTRKPAGVPDWNPYIRHGWNGPYVRDTTSMGFLDDAWSNPYRFVRNEGLVPVGLESAGPDGLFSGPPAEAEKDNITVMW